MLLGHAKLDTTARYTHVATNVLRAVMSPLDRLTLRPPTSHSPTSCSTQLRRRPSRRTSHPIPPRPIRARAAARPCTSSKCSRQANSRDTGPPPCLPPSGSILHEPTPHHPSLQRRSVSLVQDQQRQRSSECVSSRARKARTGVKFLLSGAPNLVATTVRLHPGAAGNIISARIVNAYVEIPIERAAPLRPTSRGFLP